MYNYKDVQILYKCTSLQRTGNNIGDKVHLEVNDEETFAIERPFLKETISI